MLPVESLTPRSLIDVDGLGLFLPFGGGYRFDLLVSKSGETAPVGVVVSSDRQFALIESSKSPGLDGLFFKDIKFETDPSSAFDAKHLWSPYGALIRAEDKLLITARGLDEYGMGHLEEVPLRSDLDVLSGGLRVGYYTWQIVTGSGEDRQILCNIAVEAADGPPR